MHIDFERAHVCLEQEPNNFVMTFKRGPVHWRILSNLGGVLGLDKRVVEFVRVFFVALAFLLLLNVDGVSVMLYEQTDYFFVSVASGPQKRVPSIFIKCCDRLLVQVFFNHFNVAIFDGLEQTLVALFLGHFFLDLAFRLFSEHVHLVCKILAIQINEWFKVPDKRLLCRLTDEALVGRNFAATKSGHPALLLCFLQ